MAVRTAMQVVSREKHAEVTQRRLFKEKMAGTPHLPRAAETSAATFKDHREGVSDFDRVVSLKSYQKRIADDTKAYECWLASYSQFGDDPKLERRANIIRRNKPDAKRVINKVYACWLEDGDEWGDPNYDRHKTLGGYPTRDKYEQRSSYSTHVKRRLHVAHANPSQEMIKTVWDRKKMSSFKQQEGFEFLGRPPTLGEMYSRVAWSSDPVHRAGEVVKELYGTASNDPSQDVDVRSERVNVTTITGDKLVFHPVEHHVQQAREKQFNWYQENDESLRAPVEEYFEPILDTKVLDAKLGLATTTPKQEFTPKYVVNAKSGFAAWSKTSAKQAEDGARYERWWMETDERRYQCYLAMNEAEPQGEVDLVQLGKLLKGAKYYPLVAVGEPYGDYPSDVKRMAVRFNVHPKKVEQVFRDLALEDSAPMSDEEYESLYNLDEVISGTAEKILTEVDQKAKYTTELGFEYLSVNGILVPRGVADSRIQIVKKLPPKMENVPIDCVKQEDGSYGPRFNRSVERTPAERAGLKPRSQMNRFEKLVDTLKDWGIVSV